MSDAPNPNVPAINTPPTQGDSFVADVLSSEGGRRDLKRAMSKMADRMGSADPMDSPAAKAAAEGQARDKAAGRMFDGNPHDAQGRTAKAEYGVGESVKIRSNIGNMIRDGGMEGCRGTVHSVGHVDPERGVMATLTTENEEIVSIPESALERDVRPSRSPAGRGARMSGASLPDGWYKRMHGRDKPRKLSPEYCDLKNGCDTHGTRHNLTAHSNAGDPACAKEPRPAPADELELAAGEADTE
jgi:hypothetical protein